jgi:hypothetical protein
MLFRLVRTEVDEENRVITQMETRPLFELRDDAIMMAEFEAARSGGEYGYNRDKDYWWSHDAHGRRFRFEVYTVGATEAAA